MMTILMVAFVLLSLFLSLFILLQQGKGDMGIGPLGGASQTLFGGSGGQEFFVKVTWVLGALFMAGALGISILHTSGYQSRLSGYKNPVHVPALPPETQQESA